MVTDSYKYPRKYILDLIRENERRFDELGAVNAKQLKQHLQARDEARLERIASDQLAALVRSDFASMDHDGMADTAVSLAKALAARLDQEGT